MTTLFRQQYTSRIVYDENQVLQKEETLMSSLLVRNVNHLVTCDANDRLYSNINVLAEDGVITRIAN